MAYRLTLVADFHLPLAWMASGDLSWFHASLAAPLGPPPADAGDLAAQAKAFFAADDDS